MQPGVLQHGTMTFTSTGATLHYHPAETVAAGVSPAVEPVRPARRTDASIHRVAPEPSAAIPGGETPALHVRRDA